MGVPSPPDKEPSRAHDFEQLLAEARNGSVDALGELLQSHRHYLLWLANRELSPELRAKGGASDMVQTTFLNAQKELDSFRGQSAEQLQGWLRKILLNNLANFHRDFLNTNKRQVGKEVSVNPDSSFAEKFLALADAGDSPSSALRHDEETQQLLDSIEDLPDDYRRVLKLRYWDRLTFSEIGPLMDRSPDAARKLWSRALECLTKQLEHFGDDSG